jgi:hypothetical protein
LRYSATIRGSAAVARAPHTHANDHEDTTPMNTRTLKTAGAAALGIAFAVAAAGTASASPVDNPVGALPVGTAAKTLPGASQSVDATKTTLGTATTMIPATTARTLPAGTHGLPGGGLIPVTGKGNALPTDAVTGALPGGGLGALPLG